jgi:hypothetical protein
LETIIFANSERIDKLTVPDNYDAYENYESELARHDRIHKRRENEGWLSKSDLPFYYDEEEEDE